MPKKKKVASELGSEGCIHGISAGGTGRPGYSETSSHEAAVEARSPGRGNGLVNSTVGRKQRTQTENTRRSYRG